MAHGWLTIVGVLSRMLLNIQDGCMNNSWSLILHLGDEPHAGHYQSCLLSSGNIWMSDDDRLPWLSCMHPEMQKDCYLF